MTKFEQNIQETANALNISVQDAMVLEFVAMGAWADYTNNNKAAAVAFVGAKHATGQVDGPTKTQLMAMVA